MIDSESFIADSKFTCKFLIEKLEENCQEFNEILKNYNVVKINAKDISEGSGYLSKVYKCDFIFDVKDVNSTINNVLPTFTVMLKIPGVESVEQVFSDYEMDTNTKRKTVDAVEKLVKIVHDNEITVYKNLKNKNLPLPQCYGYSERITDKQTGYLIIEYLNGIFPDLDDGLTYNQAKNIIDFIIDIQIEGYKQGDWWKNLTFLNFGDDQDENYSKQMINKLIDKQNDKFIRLIDKYSKFIVDIQTCTDISGKLFLESGLPKMFIHGDLWTNNLCFKTDPITGKASDELLAAIDWQISGAMNPLWDIGRVLIMCCDPEIRHKLDENIIDYYIDELTRKSGKKLEELSLTREELEKCQPYAYAANILFFIFMSCVHYQSTDDENLIKKRQKVINRLEQVLSDYLPMMEKHFPQYLNV